jgi:hypothetical protein
MFSNLHTEGGTTNHLVFFESDTKCVKKLRNDSTVANTLSETVAIIKTPDGTVTQGHCLLLS